MKRDKQMKDLELRKKERDDEENKIEGKLRCMLIDLQNNSTPFSYSLSGIKLGNSRCKTLAENVARNNSLLSLHLARKGIDDATGEYLARMLFTNRTLRKLELEGNHLGKLSAVSFSKALNINPTLKYLDLESNQLTMDNENEGVGGVHELMNSLRNNKTLLSLNLANNSMTKVYGETMRKVLDENFTLIDFDFSMNEFDLEDSREIQEKLKRNKATYDEDRLREWRERKFMRTEDENLKML